VSVPDPGRVLRRALLGWGLGHLALGRTSFGVSLLVSEIVAIGLVAWLAVGLADTNAYLVPFLAGIAFVAAWAWQAVAAYHAARRVAGDASPIPERSPALAMGWLTVPLLVWGAGFWLVGAGASSPSAVLDRFVTAWNAGSLASEGYPPAVVRAARDAESSLEGGPERFRDVRLRIGERDAQHATAVAEAIHYERRDSRFLWLFAGSELVPVADREVLVLDLVARPAELPGGGDVGAVRWELVGARVPEA
jgi:hypothetical protein